MTDVYEPPRQADPELVELATILSTESIRSEYQPIVELESGATIGYEALARGPRHSPLHLPSALLAVAARAGRLADLDRVCRSAALRGAVGTALEWPSLLFVNVEPGISIGRFEEELGTFAEARQGRLQVVCEFTERSLVDRPADVLGAIDRLRALGALIALDDVGVDPRSLAIMPFLKPDVIKLDMSLVQGTASAPMARTMHAVNAHANAYGALVLAEGIETREHFARALALGATHGQGWMFGRPGPPPSDAVAPSPRAAIGGTAARRPTHSQLATPFQEIAALDPRPRVASKHVLMALSKQLEVQADDLGPEAVVLASLQHARHLTAETRTRYRRLAKRAALVGIIGEEIGAWPTLGVRGGSLEPTDPLVDEWNVFVISPHFAAALTARDLGDPGDDGTRRFDCRLVYDRSAVVRAASLLMARITPA